VLHPVPSAGLHEIEQKYTPETPLSGIVQREPGPPVHCASALQYREHTPVAVIARLLTHANPATQLVGSEVGHAWPSVSEP
jgi:hypothetical protein